ncbi:MAG: hypothetical protein KAG56_08315 [Sulfurovaceae bacterium]|nr:hypothetical protein [Sulfurovaceae bacterium]
MKLLIPISYFFNTPKSEIWQLDCVTGKKHCLFTLNNHSQRSVKGKGLTGLTWLNRSQLVACDFNQIFIIQRNNGAILSLYIDNELNDLHSLNVDKDKVYLVNTGRDSIDLFDHQLTLIKRISLLTEQEWQGRKEESYTVTGDYFDKIGTVKSFFQRKVPDKWHLNHVFSFEGRIIASSFQQRQLMDVKTLVSLSNQLPERIHDGLIYQNEVWITLVSGKIYHASLIFPLQFKLFFDLFQKTKIKGWCRGLLIVKDNLYIGITAIYDKSRTPWLDYMAEETKSGIFQVNLKSKKITHFYDFTHPNGRRIFTFIKDE